MVRETLRISQEEVESMIEVRPCRIESNIGDEPRAKCLTKSQAFAGVSADGSYC